MQGKNSIAEFTDTRHHYHFNQTDIHTMNMGVCLFTKLLFQYMAYSFLRVSAALVTMFIDISIIGEKSKSFTNIFLFYVY